MKLNKSGFTLVELLTAIVILALIIGITVFSVNGVLNKSKENTKKLSINSLLDLALITVIDDDISLPAEFIIDSDGTISLSNNSNIQLYYDKEKPNGGTIYVDPAGKVTALGVTYEDGYICTMAVGENGCGKMEARNNIIANSGASLKNDPNESTRKVFAGSSIPNIIKLKENGIEQDYRIVSLESDGTIKVIREERLTIDGTNAFAYDTANETNTTGARLNEINTYCQKYKDGKYYGCNAWQAVNKIYKNGSLMGTVKTDSEVKKLLNGTYYQILDKTVKDNIVSKSFSVAGLSYNATTDVMYTEMTSTNKYDVQMKIGLLYLRDWFLASSSCSLAETGLRGLGNSGCSENNYLFKTTYWWWTMSAYSNTYPFVYRVNSTGYVNNNYANKGGGIRPVFYLSSNINLSGNGTAGNPYRIVL